jgi:hypothetical protein
MVVQSEHQPSCEHIVHAGDRREWEENKKHEGQGAQAAELIEAGVGVERIIRPVSEAEEIVYEAVPTPYDEE